MAAAIPSELGEKNVRQLLMQYAVPAIIAMTASSLYNMVDSIFIGHIPGVGHYAISGLAVTFPLMNLSTALGTLVGVGASTMLSVLLGQRNYKAAGKVLTNEFLLNIIIGLIFSVVTISFLSPILCFFGASENTLPYARDYMFIILLGNVVTHLYFGLNNVIRASGHPKMAMGLTMFTVLFNTVLDPIFIFGFGMGIKGAALATVICQCLALSYTLWFFFDQKNFLHLPARLKDFRLDLKVALDFLTIGMGPFLMNSASCIVTMLINQQLLKYKKIYGDYLKWYGKDPTDAEMRAFLGISQEKLEDIKKDLGMTKIRSLSETIGDEEESSLGDFVASSEDLEEDAINRIDRERMAEALW